MRSCFAALYAALIALPASAATIHVDTVVDLTHNDLSGSSGLIFLARQDAFSPPFSIQLAEGDTWDLQVSFQPGQSLTINNMVTAWLLSFTDQATDVVGTGQLSFLDAQGHALYTSVLKTDTEGVVHFGQTFFPGEFPGLPSSITFSGLHYTATVVDYVDPAVTVRTYSRPQLQFSGDSAVIAVPEPASALLLLAGLGGLALRRNRTRR